jgi:hypothetical protein
VGSTHFETPDLWTAFEPKTGKTVVICKVKDLEKQLTVAKLLVKEPKQQSTPEKPTKRKAAR